MENAYKNETAIQNKLQSQKEIIKKIIEIIVSNNLTIEEAHNVLYDTEKTIRQQKVTVF